MLNVMKTKLGDSVCVGEGGGKGEEQGRSHSRLKYEGSDFGGGGGQRKRISQNDALS